MPIAQNLTDLEVGKAAEYLVVADLILSGYRAYPTDQGLPYDVVLDDNGALYRIQVKASRAARAIPQRATVIPGYLFHIKRFGKNGKKLYASNAFDILALVALDIRAIAYMPFATQSNNMIVLRQPGKKPHRNATRLENIDQLPIEAALRAVRLQPPKVTTESTACNAHVKVVASNSKATPREVIDLFAGMLPPLPS